jgi:sec-independent protein translocase protein TatA
MTNTLLFFGGLGGWEILLVILIILIFFGAKRIPELAKGLGKGIREFKDATNEQEKKPESKEEIDDSKTEQKKEEKI